MRTTLLSCILAAGVALSTPSAAEPDPAVNDDIATQSARKLHVEGDTLYEQAEYARARMAYLGAWNFKKHYQIAGNLGDCEIRLGKYRDAAEHLAYFLREYPVDKPVDRLEKGKKLFEEARAKIGTIYLTVNVPKAKILVDGEVIGVSPLEEPLYLEPGDRLIEARRWRDRVSAHLRITPGFTRSLDLKLPKAPLVTRPVAARARKNLGSGDSVKRETGSKVLPVLVKTGYTLAAVAAGTAVASGMASYAMDRKRDDLRVKHPDWWCAQHPADSGCAETLRLHGLSVGFAYTAMGTSLAAAALAVGATIAIVRPRRSAVPIRMDATYTISPTSMGLGLKGQF